ncbi:uncharacterized protein LOC127807842 [Diospyros lotus]|uniref:uncharacterized protein LOC127807842 n=1 Tax=Diospyros lotus TaxID=55363 RepID=UPI00225994C0|nr:uncharacterized protein LOC127807842 [Diospyros lotus]
MSWLARSIADSLRIDDDGDDEDQTDNDNHHAAPIDRHTESEDEDEEDDDRAGRGVREDLSELRQTLTRQLWGVANFLAPPPPPPPPRPATASRPIHRLVSDRVRQEPSDQSCSGEDGLGSVGISRPPGSDRDGSMTGFSDRSTDQLESEIWITGSNFPRYEEEDDDPIRDAVGITQEVLAFAMNIAHHPETWLDFPLEEEDDIDDFDLSDAQHKHVLAIQHLTRRLAALRIELCPAHMSESYFWKVYFVLLHSRLNKYDAEILSTPQVEAARAMWMQELQKRTKKETGWLRRGSSYLRDSGDAWQEKVDDAASDEDPGNMSVQTFAFEPPTYSVTREFEKYSVASTEVHVVDKSVIEEEPLTKTKDKDVVAGPSLKAVVQNYKDDDEDEDDDWLKEDSDLDGYDGTATLLGDDEDVSFSDLEADDDCTMPVKSNVVSTGSETPAKASRSYSSG